MRAGVTMRDPSTVYLDWTVELGADVTLEPNVILRGTTSVAEGSTIGPGTTIVDLIIGRDCSVWASIVESSTVEDGATVGPFSHLRPGTVVGRGAQVGNFAELKNTRLGAGVKQHHMSYLGDAEVGDGTNVGAGTITANYDGPAKHRTTIGERAFLGVDTMLVAPVEIGEGPGPAPAPWSPGTSRRASSRWASPPGSASRASDRPRRRRCGNGVTVPITQILVLVGLTLLEGFHFVAAEIALVSVRRSRVDQLVDEGNGSARRSAGSSTTPVASWPSRQLGLTVIGFFASAYAAVSLTEGLRLLLQTAGMGDGNASAWP